MNMYPIITPRVRSLPLFVAGIGVKTSPEDINRAEGYHCNQISIISSGEGVFINGGQKYDLKAGSIFCFVSNIPHQYYSTSRDFVNQWVCFDGSYSENLMRQIAENGFCVLNSKSHGILTLMFDRLHDLLNKNGEFCQEDASALLYQMIIEIIKIKNNTGVLEDIKSKMRSVMEYVEKNYDRDISLEDISASMDMCKFSMCRSFKKTYGITLFTYLTKYRLQQAKALLSSSPHINVGEIAKSVGFNDTSYFSAVFKKHENTTPMEFRRAWNSGR